MEVAFDQLRRLSRDVSLIDDMRESSGKGKVAYRNFDFDTSNERALWKAIRTTLRLNGQPPIASAMIIVCEGANGWNDYLLLHHYDKSERVDDLPTD